MRVYEVELFKGANKFIEKDIGNLFLALEEDLKNSDSGDRITIYIKEISEESYEKLPDFFGP